jgi:hypothetical protein
MVIFYLLSVVKNYENYWRTGIGLIVVEVGNSYEFFNYYKPHCLTFFVNHSIYILLLYDFLVHHSTKKQLIITKMLVIAMVDLILDHSLYIDTVWPVVKAKIIDRQSLCPTIIIE